MRVSTVKRFLSAARLLFLRLFHLQNVLHYIWIFTALQKWQLLTVKLVAWNVLFVPTFVTKWTDITFLRRFGQISLVHYCWCMQKIATVTFFPEVSCLAVLWSVSLSDAKLSDPEESEKCGTTLASGLGERATVFPSILIVNALIRDGVCGKLTITFAPSSAKFRVPQLEPAPPLRIYGTLYCFIKRMGVDHVVHLEFYGERTSCYSSCCNYPMSRYLFALPCQSCTLLIYLLPCL